MQKCIVSLNLIVNLVVNLVMNLVVNLVVNLIENIIVNLVVKTLSSKTLCHLSQGTVVECCAEARWVFCY